MRLYFLLKIAGNTFELCAIVHATAQSHTTVAAWIARILSKVSILPKCSRFYFDASIKDSRRFVRELLAATSNFAHWKFLTGACNVFVSCIES